MDSGSGMDSWRIAALTRSTAPMTSARKSFPNFSRKRPNARLCTERDALDRSDLSLSPRERDIVRLMSEGLTNKQIARRFGITPETVKSHAKRIFLKLTVCSRAQAVYRAVTLGLIGCSNAIDDIAVGTGKAHVKSIMSELDARCRTEAASIATERGLVDVPDSSLRQANPYHGAAAWLVSSLPQSRFE